MRRYVLLLSAVSLIFLGGYVAAEALDITVLTDPRPMMDAAGVPAALIGVGLLTADVVLPVASSIVMVAHGALFGVVIGTVLSLLGRAASFLAGYHLGRYGSARVHRFIAQEELAAASRMVERWGLLAIIGTRPLPILSETTSIAAGVSALPRGPALLAATAGSLPEAVLFAATGALAGTFMNTSVVFIAVITLMLVTWCVRKVQLNGRA